MEQSKDLLDTLSTPRIAAAVVAGEPVLALALARACVRLRVAMAAVPLAALFPAASELASLHAQRAHAYWVAADPARFPQRIFGGPPLDGFGDGYCALGALVGARAARLERELRSGAAPSAAAVAVASDLADAAAFLQRMEPPFQGRELQLPANERLIKFAAGPWIEAAAAAADGALAGQAARALAGASFDRLCTYSISRGFDVRKGRGIEPGWEPPPPSAPLYGLGWALQQCARGEDDDDAVVAAARALISLASAERWLVAEVGLALVGTACQGNALAGHRGEALDSPLRDGIEAALLRGPPLARALCAVSLWGVLCISENPAVLARARLAPAIARAAHAGGDGAQGVAAALCRMLLAGLARELLLFEPAPPERSERAPPAGRDAAEWAEMLRVRHAAEVMEHEEWHVGVPLLRAHLDDAALELPRRAHSTRRASIGADEPAWMSERGALDGVWAALPPALVAAHRAEGGCGPPVDADRRVDDGAFTDFLNLMSAVQAYFQPELDAHTRTCYGEFSSARAK